ncbi:MAG: hypothetical protein ACI8W8_001576, partial [Rhodothermales bacterium]
MREQLWAVRRRVSTAMLRPSYLFCLLLLLPLAAADLVESYRTEIAPILQDLCGDCHSGRKSKGGITFEGLTDELALRQDRERWRRVREALEFQQMPPAKETQPETAERERIIAWIRSEIESPDPNNPLFLDPGPNMLRQLSREEYKRSVQDLLGLGGQDPASQAGIPHHRPPEGFSNLAGGMTIDPGVLEKYFHAAEIALERLLNEGRERDRIFFVKPDNTAGISPDDAASQVLERVVPRAYRRPVEPGEWQRLLPLFRAAFAAGDDYQLALTKAMKPVLSSPNFLYRIEKQRPPQTPGQRYRRVSDHELAVRLSYFFWSTAPDRELRNAADKGELSNPEQLRSQVARLIADGKARALTENFSVQWLRLRKLDRALPQQNKFPSYDGDLKRAMHDEVFSFLENLRKENRSLLELIDSDYTFVNEKLAGHYGIPGITGKKMQRVALLPTHHRGGLLGMAGLLTATSHTDRTKPTARGTWILDVLFGTPPSPPPEDAGTLEESKDKSDAPEPQTFRERLAQHASDSSCAACHKKMDPLGFALENYNAIGAWRESFGDLPVDSQGTLPTGETFRGV